MKTCLDNQIDDYYIMVIRGRGGHGSRQHWRDVVIGLLERPPISEPRTVGSEPLISRLFSFINLAFYAVHSLSSEIASNSLSYELGGK